MNNLIDTEPIIETPNKKSDNDVVLESYFKELLDKEFKVTYLIISDAEHKNNFINKIINKIFEAIELDEYPHIKNKNNFSVSWNSLEIKVKISSELSENNNLLWEIIFQAKFVTLEELRTRFLAAIVKDNRFKKKYCIQDEISDEICIVSYPIIRKLENNLRDYLLRFFTKKFGYQWWDKSKTPQLEGKVKERAKRTFGDMLDLQLYSIDFIDLTELLDGKAKVENRDIIEGLTILSNIREDNVKFERKIENLKNKLYGNWEKFFEAHITIGNFLKVWKDLYHIRCEIAHNSFMNLTRFIRLIDCYSQIDGELNKLIDELRIVKPIEHEILEEILSLPIFLSRKDIESIMEYNTIYFTPQNFSKESLSVVEFDLLFSSVKRDLEIIGEYQESDYQFNISEEVEEPDDSTELTSISKTVYFPFIPEEVKNALKIGMKNKKFLQMP